MSSAATTTAVDYLETTSTTSNTCPELYSELKVLLEKKLWHQISTKLIDAFDAGRFSSSEALDVYNKVVLPVCSSKINALALARIGVCVSILVWSEGEDVEAARAILEELLSSLGSQQPLALTYTQSKLAYLLTHTEASNDVLDRITGLLDECKEALGATYNVRKSSSDDDLTSTSFNNASISYLKTETSGEDMALLHSVYYEARMAYRKRVGPPEEYYNECLLYLNFTNLPTLSSEKQQLLAKDLSLAALTGEGVFHLGEVLVDHEILQCLSDTDDKYLLELMSVTAAGDVPAYLSTVEKYSTQMNAQPVLVDRADTLTQKVKLLALVNMIFERPAHERTLGFTEISERCHVSTNEVELLIMRALSLDLIKGELDQVDETLSVSWVMPRVLDNTQLQALASRFSEWAIKVSKITDYMKERAPTFV